MTNETPMVPMVWICLKKIRGYLDGTYTDKDDVYACLDLMETMFDTKTPKKRCPAGWPRD